ncbi:MAG: ABC transporter permease [Microbacterium sp.]
MIRLLHIAWQSVSRQRMRSTLTALSLILAVSALTSVAAAQGVMQHTIARIALLTGGPAVTTAVGIAGDDPVETADYWQRSVLATYGPDATAARTASIDGLRLEQDGSARAELEVTAVDPDLTRIRPFETVSGTWLDKATATIAPAVVLNQAAAEQHGSTGTWTLRWGDGGEQRTATIAGVVDDGETAPVAYLNLNQEGGWLTSGDHRVRLIVHVAGLSDTDLRAALIQTQAIADRSGQIGEAQRTDTIGQLSAELGTTARVFIAVAVVALAIAALGMLNIGLSTLAERSDELALRRAFGAHRRDIVTLMLLEAQLVAVTGGSLGIILAYAAMPLTLAAFGSTVTAEFPFSAALAGVLAGALAALAGAIAPALKAIRMPIAAIMRR